MFTGTRIQVLGLAVIIFSYECEQTPTLLALFYALMNSIDASSCQLYIAENAKFCNVFF